MRFKAGVGIRDLQPQTVLAMAVVERVCLNHSGLGYEPTVTSCDDQHDSGLHPEGKAFDVRTKDMLDEDAADIFFELRYRLDPLGFDIVWEKRRQTGQHFHIEYQPKAWEV